MSTTTTTYALVKHARGDTPWDVEVNADLDTIDTEIARPRLPFNSPTVGATTTCDLALARVFVFTVSQVTTLAFTNVPSSSFACRIRLLITNGSAFALTFPAAVTWLGMKPALRASGTDEVELVTKDGGTTWFATLRRPTIGVINQQFSLTTTSGVDASLGTYVLPAGTLAVNGQALRITIGGTPPAGGGTVNIRFGAGGIGNFAVGAVDVFLLTIILTRTGAATQIFNNGFIKAVAPLAGGNGGAGAETLANAITIDFRGNVTTGGQTMTYNTVQVELLAA